MNTKTGIPKGLIKKIIERSLLGFVLIAAFIFLPAWTLKYWQAWLFLALIFIPMLGIIVYFLVKKPDFLARRLNMKEKLPEQSTIIKISFIPLMLAFILPGFDVRLGWSNLPVWLVLLSDLFAFLAYGMVFLVFRENSFASRVVEVTEGQRVIDTGPYAFVRHPMYLGSVVMYLFSPLALGSAWAVIPALFMIPVMVARIISEERLLNNELPGYSDYTQKVRYRLFPGIW